MPKAVCCNQKRWDSSRSKACRCQWWTWAPPRSRHMKRTPQTSPRSTSGRREWGLSWVQNSYYMKSHITPNCSKLFSLQTQQECPFRRCPSKLLEAPERLWSSSLGKFTLSSTTQRYAAVLWFHPAVCSPPPTAFKSGYTNCRVCTGLSKHSFFSIFTDFVPKIYNEVYRSTATFPWTVQRIIKKL